MIDVDMTGSKRKKILYIEDDPNHQFTMELLLGEQYDVVAASDGKGGIETAVAVQPEMVIVDIMLHNSDIDGYEIIRNIRSLAQFVDIPIIAITGHTGEAEKARCFQEGCTGFFTKPLDVDRFASDISNFINPGTSD